MTLRHLILVPIVAGALGGTAHGQPPPGPPLEAPVKYALLIGINEYQAGMDVPTLSYAEADVTAMADALKTVGYKPTVLTSSNNATMRLNIISAIQRFVLSVKPQDTFLLYMAGHGVRNPANGKVYWLATDTVLSMLEGSGIRMAHLLDYFADVKAKRKILLLDHCMSGDVVSDLTAATTATAPVTTSYTTIAPPIPPGSSLTAPPARGGPSPGGAHLERRNVEPIHTTLDNQWNGVPGGTLVLAAARDDAFESETIKHGVFTSALLEAFTSRVADSNGDGQLSADELANFVHDRVPTIAKTMLKPAQTQEVADYKSGSFTSFTLTATLPDTTVQEADQLKQLVSEWYGTRYLLGPEATFCYEVLKRLVDAKTSGSPLDPADESVVRALRDAAAPSAMPERARVELLIQEIHRIGGGR
jgi:hypothetical protein